MIYSGVCSAKQNTTWQMLIWYTGRMKNHAAIVLHDSDKILFVQRSATKKSLPNIWAFASGTVEEGEKIEQTIIREAKEELGVDVSIESTLATVELTELGVRLYFVVCISKSGEPSIQEPREIQKLRWLTFKEFFDEYSNDQIGHGLMYLRKHPEIWESKKS